MALIGSVAGNKPFDRLAVDLFRDAGMRDAEMARALVTNGVVDSAPSKGLALGYACEKDGGEPTSSYSFVQLGAGAVYASAPDLMNLDDALRKGLVLSQRFQRLTIADAFPVNEAVNYGYGWMVRHVNDHAYLQHGGGNNGYVTEFARGVDRAVTLVIMSNDSCAPVGELRARIMEAVLS